MKRIQLWALILLMGPVSAFAQGLSRDMQFWRPNDKRGVNVFEPTKEDSIEFEGLRVRVGGHFAQNFQSLSHSNASGSPALIEIGAGTNLAAANLDIDVALEDGIRMSLITYLSSRRNPETWVMGGYIQFDKLPFFGNPEWFSKYLTLRVGHMQISYSDAVFRRTNNGNSMWNPFVENYIMDAFTTEVGGEVLFRKNGWIALASLTGGEIQPNVSRTRGKKSFIGKVGYDKQLSDELRIRLTGSIYTTKESFSNTLYSGDRAGSRYFFVMSPPGSTASGTSSSGRITPQLNDNVTSTVINPFVKYQGLEFFGHFESAVGRTRAENENRNWNQFAADLIYRFGVGEKFYLGGRYNTVKGKPLGFSGDVNIDRLALAGGWFITKNILAKLEYVNQNYSGYPAGDILSGGNFNGIMIDAVIGF